MLLKSLLFIIIFSFHNSHTICAVIKYWIYSATSQQLLSFPKEKVTIYTSYLVYNDKMWVCIIVYQSTAKMKKKLHAYIELPSLPYDITERIFKATKKRRGIISFEERMNYPLRSPHYIQNHEKACEKRYSYSQSSLYFSWKLTKFR